MTAAPLCDPITQPDSSDKARARHREPRAASSVRKVSHPGPDAWPAAGVSQPLPSSKARRVSYTLRGFKRFAAGEEVEAVSRGRHDTTYTSAAPALSTGDHR